MNRRHFLGVLGASAAVCAMGGTARAFRAPMTNGKGPKGKGMVTFTFDDGIASTNRYALPVLKKWGMAATAGIVVGKMLSDDNDYMDLASVRELESNGWEIASHGMSRVSPLNIPRLYEQEPLSGWRPDKDNPAHFQARYDYEYVPGLYQDGTAYKGVESLNRLLDTPGTYWLDRTIAELHVHVLRGGDPESLNIRTGSLQRGMEESKRSLTELGFTVDTFVAPKNYWTQDEENLCKRYYARACAQNDSDNRRATFNPYSIKRFTVRKGDTPQTLVNIIKDHSLAAGSWVVFCLHGVGEDLGWGTYPVESLDSVCAWIAEQKIPVVTVREGCRQMLETR